MKKFKLGGQSKLQSAKSFEGTSFCNACSQKKKYEYKILSYTSLVIPFLDMGLHPGIHAEDR